MTDAPTSVGKAHPMLTVVPDPSDSEPAEVDAYIARFIDERDERGHRLVVRNRSHQPREVLTSPDRSR